MEAKFVGIDVSKLTLDFETYKAGMGAMLADTPPSQPSPIFMGEGGTKVDHCVINLTSSKQSEAVY